MRGDILISGIVWFKVYAPNKLTPENSVKKLGPENWLITRKKRCVIFQKFTLDELLEGCCQP